jgi:hypothetical protein
MKHGTLHSLVLCVALVAVVVLPGCASRSEPREWIESSEASHREADRLAASGDPSGAADALRRAATRPAPAGMSAEDARVVRQDLYYRLAMGELGASRAHEAVQAATDGLALGQRRDVFTANLLVVRGQAYEAIGDRKNASVDYHEALVVNEALLDTALGGAGGTP